MFEFITVSAVAALAFALGFAVAWVMGGKTREQLAAAEARAEEQAYAAADKLALVATAKNALSDSFKALSAEALEASNRNFLDLARTALGTFQERAQGDLPLMRLARTDGSKAASGRTRVRPEAS